MFESFLHYLRTPYSHKDYRPWHTIAVVWGIVMFVLCVFQPFGISSAAGWTRVGVLLFSGLGSLAGLVGVLIGLPGLFPRYYEPQSWTIGKNLLNQVLLLFTIGLCTAGMLLLFWTIVSGGLPSGWLRFVGNLLLSVLILSPLPLAVTFFMLRSAALQARLSEVQELNNRLAEKARLAQQSLPCPTETEAEGETATARAAEKERVVPDVRLSLAGSTRESLTISPEDLLFIEAAGNYVKVRYVENGRLRQKLLRATLRQMEEALKDFPALIRCHRAYVVNVNRIVKVGGSAAGYRLSVGLTEEEVPVSRAYTKGVRERLEGAGGRLGGI